MAQRNNRRPAAPAERRYPDSLLLSNGRMVRVSELDDDAFVSIGRPAHRLRVGDIPFTSARLTCGDTVRAIALSVGDILFCERHSEDESVVEIISGS